MKVSCVLRRLGACRSGLAWVRAFEREHLDATPLDLWAACPRGAWLLWAILKLREDASGADRDRWKEIHARAATAWARAGAREEAAAIRAAVESDWELLVAAFGRATAGAS